MLSGYHQGSYISGNGHIALRNNIESKWRLSRIELTANARNIILVLIGEYQHAWEVVEAIAVEAAKSE